MNITSINQYLEAKKAAHVETAFVFYRFINNFGFTGVVFVYFIMKVWSVERPEFPDLRLPDLHFIIHFRNKL
jgi:hypothetical protein